MPADLALRRSDGAIAPDAEPEPAQPGAPHEGEGEGEGEEEEAERPWEESDFEPFPSSIEPKGYFADGGVTYKVDKTSSAQVVCGFVAEPIAEIVTILDLDHHERRERRLVVRYTLPTGQQHTVTLEPAGSSGDVTSALLRGVPSDLARASVVRRRDVALAASAFRSPRFETVVRVRQCGWLPDKTFALPGTDVVDLQHVSELPGARLWEIPSVLDLRAAREGALALLEVCASAPIEVIAPVVGTVFAAPIFRGEDHLAARGFATLVVGPSQRGKTTLVRSACGLLGRFDQQPGCVATWMSTFTSLEQALHAYRDLPVIIDDFRETDGEARETFRRLVLALGDGSGRGRTGLSAGGARVTRAFQLVALLLATGEQSIDDDAAIAGRIVEVTARDIDVARLLEIAPEQRHAMPHTYAAYLAFLSALPEMYWSAQRDAMRALALELGSSESRAAENLATVVIALNIVTDFFNVTFVGNPEITGPWQEFMVGFRLRLPEIMREHARRVREEAIDEVVLAEIARGLCVGEIRLARLPTGRAAPPDARGKLVGAYDREKIYLQPDIITRWVSDQLLHAKRRCASLGRKTLGRALAARAGVDGDFRTQRMIEGKVQWLWPVPRSGLSDVWQGLLDDVSWPDASPGYVRRRRRCP
ncbi:DUF927 domain-containing protein [Polyangium spumosum]|uniref:DUF927 domain-containing protein n=1 Tax=Polyangium spumosum TaxID=889282 RepID=A0A6N7Q150_9BACT|nr:DUF927 domain-containing protein [Polyangium spumosum]MRG96520.1 DUF927 domain-containing protein [Polyangium spumosum]